MEEAGEPAGRRDVAGDATYGGLVTEVLRKRDMSARRHVNVTSFRMA